jgi:hypothetical protein
VPCRIITYGLEWENEPPEWLLLFNRRRRSSVQSYLDQVAAVEAIKQEEPPKDADRRTKVKHKLRLKEAQWDLSKMSGLEGIEQLPEPTLEHWVKTKDHLERSRTRLRCAHSAARGMGATCRRATPQKDRTPLHHKHSDPGTAFSYDEWKSGTHGGKAIVDMVTDRPINPNCTPPRTPHEPYTICLQNQFRSQGLQVVTRIESISLDVHRPEYMGGTWELAGHKSEHIVVIAMFAYDVHNITQSHIAFRQETDVGADFFCWGSHLHSDWKVPNRYGKPVHRQYKNREVERISDVFGFNPDQMCRFPTRSGFALPIQEIGRVALPQGRLIAVPNTIEHRREPFRLEDPTKPGHHRWVTVMLVDPHYRICSTRNVPPQWRRRDGEQEANDGCFRQEEAEGYRLEREKEHVWTQDARYKMMQTFSFCQRPTALFPFFVLERLLPYLTILHGLMLT